MLIKYKFIYDRNLSIPLLETESTIQNICGDKKEEGSFYLDELSINARIFSALHQLNTISEEPFECAATIYIYIYICKRSRGGLARHNDFVSHRANSIDPPVISRFVDK